jgi:hypothetical protein
MDIPDTDRIDRADLSYSCTWPSNPHLSRIFPYPEIEQQDSAGLLDRDNQWLITRNELTDVIGREFSEVLDMFHSLHLRFLSPTSNESQQRHISRLVYILERSLLEMNETPPQRAHSTFQIVFRYAGLLYITIVLRDLPMKAVRVRSVTDFLGSMANDIVCAQPLGNRLHGSLVLLLWAQTVVLVATPKEELQASFVENLRATSTALGIDSVGTLTQTLRMIGWKDGVLEDMLGRLLREPVIE